MFGKKKEKVEVNLIHLDIERLNECLKDESLKNVVEISFHYYISRKNIEEVPFGTIEFLKGLRILV